MPSGHMVGLGFPQLTKDGRLSLFSLLIFMQYSNIDLVPVSGRFKLLARCVGERKTQMNGQQVQNNM